MLFIKLLCVYRFHTRRTVELSGLDKISLIRRHIQKHLYIRKLRTYFYVRLYNFLIAKAAVVNKNISELQKTD